MNDFLCKNCFETTFERLTYTTVKCKSCGTIFESPSDYRILDIKQKSIPQETTIKQTIPIHFKQSSLIHRVANYFIDKFVVAFGMLFIFSFFDFNHGVKFLFFPLAILIAYPIYYITMEQHFGKTIGKYITRTKVVSTTGLPLTQSQCIQRTLCRIIPFNTFSGILFNGNFWHDSISKTMVVED